MSKARVSDWASSALMLVVAAAAAFMIWSLAVENREMKQEISDLYAELNALQETTALQDTLAEGDTIPDTPVVGLAGETSSLDELIARGGVIAFLTTTCPYCEETLPAWSRLADQYAARGVPFVGVVLGGATPVSDYVSRHAIEWPIWSLDDSATADDVRVSLVPYTALIAPDGVVKQVWSGVLEASDSARLAAALDEELHEPQQMLSGLSATDPDCCPAPTHGTEVAGGR